MKRRFLALVLITGLLFSACDEDQTLTSTPDMNLISTIAAETVSAQGTLLAATLRAEATPVQTPTLAQPQLPTSGLSTTTPTVQPVSTNTSVPVSSVCDKASFVADVTIPDNSVITAGTSFTKTWRLMNAGTCTWTTSYKAVFISGNSLSASTSIALTSSVAPGHTIDIPVVMTAPTTSGTYTGYWMLQNASGTNFGIGALASGQFSVVIVVGSGATITGTLPTSTPGTPTATLTYFMVETSSLSTTATSFSGTCPMTINFTGSLTASRAGTVSYHFIHSDGSDNYDTEEFTEAGTHTITDIWEFNSSVSGANNQIYIDDPNHSYMADVTFDVSCTS